MFALALGLLALRLLPVLPPVGWLLVLPVVALMLLPFRTYPLAFFLLGLAWACFSAQRALDDRLIPALRQPDDNAMHRRPSRPDEGAVREGDFEAAFVKQLWP
eukprot:gene11352-14437_t